MSGKTIVVLATMDTKGKEAEFLRAQIKKHGQTAMIVDVGVIGTPATKADVTRAEVAAAGGSSSWMRGSSPEKVRSRSGACVIAAAGR
jgi:uncharacterized protein (UPF0261 family)